VELQSSVSASRRWDLTIDSLRAVASRDSSNWGCGVCMYVCMYVCMPCVVLCCVVLCCSVVYFNFMCCMCFGLRYCIVLHHAILHCTVWFYYITLYYNSLYYLYCILLYCNIL
jgi:hypothetical protein